MGNKDDCSPGTWASAAFGVVSAALAYAKDHLPDFVPELEERQIEAARLLSDIDK